MSRFALAVAVALCLSSVPLYAQSPRFTVTALSASIYQAPSAGSPVIGQRSEGAMLDVRGEAAGWIEVAWPNAAKGIAYVRAASGRIEKPAPNRVATPLQRPMTIDEYVHGTSTGLVPTSLPASGSPNPSAAYVAEAVAAVSAASTSRSNAIASSATYVTPAHFVGLGGRIGNPTLGVGATGRVWSPNRIGVQFEIFRDARANVVTAERITTLQFSPSVLYALPNAVSDYFWVRPYVGGGATIHRSTLRRANVAEISSPTESSLGLQLFGGGEVTFAGMPRFALSADVGYRKMQPGFAGFERRKIGLALSGHWFVR